ncbi:unnamed protein product [Moneuplotes crassus]|uniref:Uncharacterized protein n=1 Tax=Euplotes crassus TaxID=5936 RepID=A0AAD1YBC4_EUPCR|nr:unnamed protein product [Moneuplotes crassus]
MLKDLVFKISKPLINLKVTRLRTMISRLGKGGEIIRLSKVEIVQAPQRSHIRLGTSRIIRERKDPRKHIEEINTSYMQQSAKSNDGKRTNGRWTAEEHRKFVEALKMYGKQWKKVEEHIKTRSGAQIRSHAQKYFLKIQKEYPDQDAFQIFKNNSPEFLEETIYMKNRDESEENKSNHSRKVVPSEPCEIAHEDNPKKEDNSQPKAESFNDNEFANSVKMLLEKRKEAQKEQPMLLPQNPHYQDILQIRNFYEHVQKILPSNNLPPLNQIATDQKCNEILQEFKTYRDNFLAAQKQSVINNTQSLVAGAQPTGGQNYSRANAYFNQELYNNICGEIIKLKERFNKVQNAELTLMNTALDTSSLDSLIRASLNSQFVGRNRVDSLCNVRQHSGRKRAMTVDGPVKNKYARLNHTQNSAFVSFKSKFNPQETVQETKDEEMDSKDTEMKIEEPKLNKKFTQVIKDKDEHLSAHQPLLSQDEAVLKRKRARSF